MAVLLGVGAALFLPITTIFFIRNFSQWKNKKFKESYGAFYDGLRTDRLSSVFYHISFVVRRIAFTVIAIVASNYLFVQIFVLMLMSTL